MGKQMKKAFITGVSGQDGAYLAQLLLKKDYKVYGTTRNLAGHHLWRLKELNVLDNPCFHLMHCDLESLASLREHLKKIDPDEVYNFAATSFVPVTPDQLEIMSSATGVGPLRLLEAVREVNLETKFFQAGSSEMFGQVHTSPQNEQTPFHPRNAYGAAKLYAYWNTRIYREIYNIYACNGILYNHESPLREELFVTRKISHSLASIKLGQDKVLELGNLDAKRDWGYAPEYMDAIWRMMQQEHPDCYVLASGRTASVRNFVELTASALDMEIEWEGDGKNEVGRDRRTGMVCVRINPEFYRPCEAIPLVGDSQKARTVLNWTPTVSLEAICEKMARADIERIKKTERRK